MSDFEEELAALLLGDNVPKYVLVIIRQDESISVKSNITGGNTGLTRDEAIATVLQFGMQTVANPDEVGVSRKH